MRVLVACEFSGIVRDAFRAVGHDAWSCDFLCCVKGPKFHIRDDVRRHFFDSWDLMIAHPPCTHLAVSGAGHFSKKRKNGKQQQGIDLFLEFTKTPMPRVAIENPVGIMSTVYRKPDQIIQPWQFGDAEVKTTCLWLYGLPKLEPTNVVEPKYIIGKNGKRYSQIHFAGSRQRGQTRWMARSKTYLGIAIAMADQWGKLPVECAA